MNINNGPPNGIENYTMYVGNTSRDLNRSFEGYIDYLEIVNIDNYLTTAFRVFDMTEMSVGSGSGLTLVPNVVGPDGKMGNVWRMQHYQAVNSVMGIGGQYLDGNPANIPEGNYKISVWAKRNNENEDDDIDDLNEFTLWYYSGNNSVSYTELGHTFKATNTWKLFEYDALFSDNNNESVGLSNVPDDYSSDIYIWGFSLQKEVFDHVINLSIDTNGMIKLKGTDNSILDNLRLQSIQVEFSDDDSNSINNNEYTWQNLNNDEWLLETNGNMYVGSVTETGINILTNTLKQGDMIDIKNEEIDVLLIGHSETQNNSFPMLKTDSVYTQILCYNITDGSLNTFRNEPSDNESKLIIKNV